MSDSQFGALSKLGHQLTEEQKKIIRTIAGSGLEDYKLGKDYGSDKAGTVIQVDSERRKWLDEHGYGKLPKPVSPEPPALPRRRRPLTPGEEE